MKKNKEPKEEDAPKIKEIFSNTITFNSSCGSCENISTINMPYQHAALLFQGQSLNYICKKCGQRNDFNLSHIKEVIDGLPKNKKNHFYDFLSNYNENKPSQQVVSGSDSWGWVILLMILIFVGIWFYPNISQFVGQAISAQTKTDVLRGNWQASGFGYTVILTFAGDGTGVIQTSVGSEAINYTIIDSTHVKITQISNGGSEIVEYNLVNSNTLIFKKITYVRIS